MTVNNFLHKILIDLIRIMVTQTKKHIFSLKDELCCIKNQLIRGIKVLSDFSKKNHLQLIDKVALLQNFILKHVLLY